MPTRDDRLTLADDRLRGLSLNCPRCGTRMAGTGKAYYSDVVKRWLVEYRCPAEEESHEIWTPEGGQLAEAIAREEGIQG